MRMHEWHTAQEDKARRLVAALAIDSDLSDEVRERRIRRWADLADWHMDRAQSWIRWDAAA